MRLLISALGSLVFISCSGAPDAPVDIGQAKINPDAGAVHYVNGQWYEVIDDEVRFTPGDRYAVDGVFIDQRPAEFTTMDLNGAYIVPPFGEAHNHSVDAENTKKTARKYLKEGVFYYKNANGIYSYTEPMLDYWAAPGTLDMSFAYGGLSKDEGHPEQVYRTLSGFGLYAKIDVDDMDGNAFFDVDTVEKLDARWDGILANNPDFLKLYLLEHDTETSAGLNEDIFREIVGRANALGLRTSVHVESVQDLALAVDAGASEAAHLPAYDLKYAKDESRSRIPDELIAQMAERGFSTITTTLVSSGRGYSEEDYKTVADRQADNLQRMFAGGAPIAIGSDTFFDTVSSEIETLRGFEIFKDSELLRLWVETPKLSIFPDRAIGALSPGYEASFLALTCNPAVNIDCTKDITRHHKQGVDLSFEEEAAAPQD